MERGICKICGRFYAKGEVDQRLCSECFERDEKQYLIVKEFIVENRSASIMDIYLETKVPVKSIKRFIEDDKINIVEE